MYVSLKKHVIPEPKAAFIRIGVSLAFALTPFWPSGMLSTLGYPLALWAFEYPKGDISWREWLTLGLLPLYSSFVLGFFFSWQEWCAFGCMMLSQKKMEFDVLRQYCFYDQYLSFRRVPARLFDAVLARTDASD